MQRFDNTDVRTPLTSTSQFIEADQDDDFENDIPVFTQPAIADPLKGKGRAPEELNGGSGSGYPSGSISGNIGGPASESARPSRTMIGGVQVETRYTGVDTLDEPISTTFARDALSIYTKLIQVLYPPRAGSKREVLRDWDLWGPLVICLTLGILLSVNAPASQSLVVFTSVVVIISVGSLVVTVQSQLLGGKISFFQGLCVFGYCVAPLNIAALVAAFVHHLFVRAPIALAAWAWCIWASINFLDGTNIEQQRVILAVYPLFLFYSILAWMIIIQ